MVTFKHPNNPATPRQLWKIKELSGNDTTGLKITMKEASEVIERLELNKLEQQGKDNQTQDTVDDSPFSEAHVTIVEGSQRSGKSCYAVGKIVDSYFKDCAKIWCEKVGIKGEVKSYDRKNRIAKIKVDGKVKFYKIREDYQMYSPMRIFSNIHLYGLPYVYIPSFRHLLKWLKCGFVCKGWLLMDEAHVGINARAGMSKLGQELEKQSFQFGKLELDVIMITHMARLIDWTARTIPTQHVSCSFDAKKNRISYKLHKKGQHGTGEYSFDATQYWGNYRTNEKVNA